VKLNPIKYFIFDEYLIEMQYMIVEKFKKGKLKDVYQRFAERGRLAPEGLMHVNSWITEDLSTCYQVMETDNFHTLEQWMDVWKDLVDFEVIPVINSREAREKIDAGS
jgi:hypothetical protein